MQKGRDARAIQSFARRILIFQGPENAAEIAHPPAGEHHGNGTIQMSIIA